MGSCFLYIYPLWTSPSLNLTISCHNNTLDHNYELLHNLQHLLKQTTILKTDTQATRLSIELEVNHLVNAVGCGRDRA